MLVIVEGVDGAGKSTLVNQLADRISGDLTVSHLGQPKRHPLEETVLPLNDYLPGTGAHVVCDRFHLGEMIYGPIYRDASQLGPIGGPGHRWIDGWLRSVGGLQVLVDSDVPSVTERLGVRGEDFLKAQHYGRVIAEYHRAFFESRCRRLLGWMPGLKPESVLADARTAESTAAVSLLHQARLPFVGNPYPKVILVGDEPSPRHASGERPGYRAPFVPYRDGCGWFLFGALTDRTNVRAAVVNQVDLTEDHRSLLRDVPVVALGRRADVALSHLGVTHATVPHPQFVRRFHHDRQAVYGELIEHATGTSGTFKHLRSS